MLLRLAPLLVLAAVAAAGEPAGPWPAPVPGFTPPAAGEHPRLLFRKAELPEIRKRAATPEGKAIVARLKRLLGGGEAMPTSYNTAKAAYTSDAYRQPIGTYTIGHAAGFGMLWQLTGDKKYADLARDCIEKGLAGQRDRDDRYSYRDPGGFLRAGPSLVALCLGYDLGYDGWDPAFRERVRAFIHDYDGGQTGRDGGGRMTLERMATKPILKVESNHWLCQVGGAGMAVLAVRNDPGSDNAKLDGYWKQIEANTIAGLTKGYGDWGYFFEHMGPGQISSDTGFVMMMQAARVAGGTDFMVRNHAKALATRWVHRLLTINGRPMHPMFHSSGYGTPWFGRGNEGTHQLSHAGIFAQGFGILPKDEALALLWTYRKVVEPAEAKDHAAYIAGDEKSYDGVIYPHFAVAALVNWPIGQAERNPAEVFPHAIKDSIHGYYITRNRWQDTGDVVVAVLAGARDTKDFGRGRPIQVWGAGNQRLLFKNIAQKSTESHYQTWPDGSMSVTLGQTSLAVDYSRASGADAVVVVVNPEPVADQTKAIGTGADSIGVRTDGVAVQAGGTTYHVLVVGGKAEPVASGQGVKVGGQTFTFANGRIDLAVAGKSAAGKR